MSPDTINRLAEHLKQGIYAKAHGPPYRRYGWVEADPTFDGPGTHEVDWDELNASIDELCAEFAAKQKPPQPTETNALQKADAAIDRAMEVGHKMMRTLKEPPHD